MVSLRFVTVGINSNDSTLQRFFKQQSASDHHQTSLSSLLPRTPKDITLTPITTEANSVIDTSDCNHDDNEGIEDDKMLFAGLGVQDLTPPVDNVEDGINNTTMSNFFAEQKIDSETSSSGVRTPQISATTRFLFYK